MRITFCTMLLIVAFSGMAQETVESSKVYVIPLREDVDRYLGVFLGRSLQRAEQANAELIIIEIDTFGGRVDTALEIASKIGAANWAKTVAYIPADSASRGVSWSAGALMAFSCSEIWMSPGTSMGAAAPVYQTSEGMQAAEEKTVSAVRGQMAALAEKNGYPVEVALAMVDADIVLQEITIDNISMLRTAADIEVLERQNADYIVGKTLSDAGKLLTLTAGEMERYKVSKGTVSTRDELIESYGYSSSDTVILEKDRADSLITVITSGAVTSILLLIGLVALYLELTSPGFGIPGTIALICFTIVFGSGGLIGNLEAAEILFFLLGFILLILEIFVIPGFGVAGIAGIVLILGSLVFSLQDFYLPEFGWQWSILYRSLGIVFTSFLGGLVFIAIIMATLPRISLFDRLVLKGPQELGYAGKLRRRHEKAVPENPSDAVPTLDKPDNIQRGAEGVAITDLRPVGKVRIANRTIVAETYGVYYEKGTPVTVTEMDGVRIIVTQKEHK